MATTKDPKRRSDECKDCFAEGITSHRAAPHVGPRCATHHRLKVGPKRQPNECRRCFAEGVKPVRPLATKNGRPVPGPCCVTHHRATKRKRSARAHELHTQKTYGLTAVQYWALYAAQGGRCFVCRRASGKAKRLAVDHDHDMGCGHPPDQGCPKCVRCLACGPCNQDVLGRYDVDALARAITVKVNPPARAILEELMTRG